MLNSQTFNLNSCDEFHRTHGIPTFASIPGSETPPRLLLCFAALDGSSRHLLAEKTAVGKCGEMWWMPISGSCKQPQSKNAAMFLSGCRQKYVMEWMLEFCWTWSDINGWAHREIIIINIEELSVQQPNCEKIRRVFLAMKIQFWKSLPHGHMEKVSSDTKEMPNCFQNAVSLLRADYSSPRCS